MGFTSYSISNRTDRAASTYAVKSTDEIFTQNKLHRIHPEMNPHGITVRECCDSVAHPATVPIQLYLDVTGSMGRIPVMMIKSGLPTLISTLIQNGVPDTALMFGAIGDHTCDQAPLQVGQFESGDAELDMWLERTWLEGRGGANEGESYLLAWYFAANHVRIDAFSKRNTKGFVFTIGDEPCLNNLPVSAITAIMGKGLQGTGSFSREHLLERAQQENHVFHIHIDHNRYCDPWWMEALGQNLIRVNDYTVIPAVISQTILDHMDKRPLSMSQAGLSVTKPNTPIDVPAEIIL